MTGSLRKISIHCLLVISFCGLQGALIADNGPVVVTPASAPVLAPAPAPTQPVLGFVETSYDGTSSSTPTQILHAEEIRELHEDLSPALMPMFGASGFAGDWTTTGNSGLFGLVLDMPQTPKTDLEIEGTYGGFNTTFLSDAGDVYSHDFDLYTLGANLKFYFTTGTFRPYFGLGLGGEYFSGMNAGPGTKSYGKWIGTGQLLGGLELTIFKGVALGVRGAWICPLFKRPELPSDPPVSGTPGAAQWADQSLMNTSYYRLLGTLRISL